ncbi:hypothetical protein FRC00_009124 [Tulasnella sp. 408]|nr:hypothetical protein FRC00_009124 [Tulasnella sp. 408]
MSLSPVSTTSSGDDSHHSHLSSEGQYTHDERSHSPPDMSASGSANGRSRGSMLGRGLACVRCRKRKQRCDAKEPSCSNCSGAQADCQYVALPVRPRPKPQMTAGEALAAKLARLQEQYDSLLSRVAPASASGPAPTIPPLHRSTRHSRSSTSGTSETEYGGLSAGVSPGEY